MESIIYVLGMHRSGTSCLTGMLEKHGAYISHNKAKQTKDNIKGNKEDPKVFKLNDKILAHNGFKWHKPPIEAINLKINNELNKEIQAYKKSILTSAQNKPVVIKDPRMLFCLKFWRSDNDKLIGTFRRPQAVVKSLQTRNNSLENPLRAEWLRIWIRYNRELLKLQKKYSFPLVNFDWEQSHYEKEVSNLAEHKLGLNSIVKSVSFYDRELIHNKQPSQDEIKSIYARDIYKELLERL